MIFNKAKILIPDGQDNTKWSVVACDQYTSEPAYWEAVRNFAGDAPSALNVIFPEIYLNDGDAEQRIQNINAQMERYISSGVLKELEPCFIYVERTQRDGRVRHGIIGAVDLEEYDFSSGSQSRIRATEGTITERIPPRVRIRENAALELPHIIMLADDRKRTITEPLTADKDSFEKLYDFDLMMESGHLTGWRVPDAYAESVIKAVEALGDRAAFEEKYGVSGAGVLQFAVGDGNHSLATAKTCWENLKKGLTEEERKTHPARFALAELMNIHDEALEFEPIHRVVFGADSAELLNELEAYGAELDGNGAAQRITAVTKDGERDIEFLKPSQNLAVGTLQRFLDAYIEKTGAGIDYIHGAEVVRALAAEKDCIGFILPPMSKEQLFETVIKDGALPRKTFSMGEAQDKRFYMEAKRLKA